MEKRKEGNLKMEFINSKRLKKCLKTRFKRTHEERLHEEVLKKTNYDLHSRKYNMKSTESESSFKTIMKSKEEFHETNQLKKESKEMNSKLELQDYKKQKYL
jgi:hypothetical protein